MEGSDEWADQLGVGYGIPGGLARWFAPAAVPNVQSEAVDARYYRVAKNGKSVAVSMMLLRDGVAGIYCVATLEEERGKGLGAYVTAQPMKIAREMGYGVGILQSSEDGYPVYQRLGFEDFAKIGFYLKMPADAKASSQFDLGGA